MGNRKRYLQLFQPILAGLEADRNRAEAAVSRVEGYGAAIQATREKISQMEALAPKALKSREGEITYFREVWPRVYGELFYYLRGYAFFMERGSSSPDRLPVLIQKEEVAVRRFFRTHWDFWTYYNSGSGLIDGQFTRGYSRECVFDPLCMVIGQGATLASYYAAWGLAYEKYRGLLEKERERLLHKTDRENDIGEYTWQASDADAVEFLYSLNAGKVILHDGEPADIIQLSRWFRVNFRKEIVNIYDRFKAVRNRKKDRVPFMRKLLGGLEKRMDEADGKYDD